MRVTRVHVDAPLAAGMRLALPVDAAAYLTRVLRTETAGIAAIAALQARFGDLM